MRRRGFLKKIIGRCIVNSYDDGVDGNINDGLF